MRIIVFCIVILACFTSCDKDVEPNKTGNPIDNTEKITEMNNTIAWDLFIREQEQKPAENVLISPWSIQSALNMAVNGAKNESRVELLDFMGCDDCRIADLNKRQADLYTMLKDENGHPDLSSVNAYFYDNQRMELKSDFEDVLEEDYDCSFKTLDFSDESGSLNSINGFVEQATNGKIDKILSRIQSEDVAFLLNALHFKADWLIGFNPQLGFTADFEKADGTVTSADYVSADRTFNSFEGQNLRGVDIPLKDSTYSVTLIQPTEANMEPAWSQKIQTSDWLNVYTSITQGRAITTFPKLKLSYENDIIASMRALGVQAPFSSQNADFSNMGSGSQGNIYISQVKHKAVLEMDEMGIEGAAVTSVGFSQTSLPPVFRFDNPYVLVVRHIETNTILFLAYVADPS